MNHILTGVLVLLNFLAIGQRKHLSKQAAAGEGKAVKIEWVDNLPGDFSFAKKWSYPEGVYRNEHGQLSCDGICPEEVDAMKDSAGKIYEDSLTAFYQLVDTTHQYHSLKADAWCYEYAGSDFIDCYDVAAYECYTRSNAGTHCSLELSFDEKYCNPYVSLTGILNNKKVIFYCTQGTFKVDKKSFEKGILKAIFDFKFKNTSEPKKPIYWKGKIFTENELPRRKQRGIYSK